MHKLRNAWSCMISIWPERTKSWMNQIANHFQETYWLSAMLTLKDLIATAVLQPWCPLYERKPDVFGKSLLLTHGCFPRFQISNSTAKSQTVPGAEKQLTSSVFMAETTFRGYIVLVDYYSNFLEVIELPDTLERHPRLSTTDNGSQIVSQDFKQFATDWVFK